MTTTHTLTDELSAIDWCYEQGWTDGLPVVPPARERVERFLAAAGRPPEEIVARHPATGRECSVQSAAVNAVMAGCLPQYFPTVLAALEGLNEDAYNFHGSTASTGGSGPLLIVSGDIRDEIGMNAGVNVFGPGNRANATIGRAIRLVIMNIFQMIPGISDRSTTGWPGKYSACIAENILLSPWEPLHESLGFPPEVSTVTVFAASGFYNVENHYTSDPRASAGHLCRRHGLAGRAHRRPISRRHVTRSTPPSPPPAAGAAPTSKSISSSTPTATAPRCCAPASGHRRPARTDSLRQSMVTAQRARMA